MQNIAVSALTESDAKQDWRDAKHVSQDTQQIHRDAKIEFAEDKSDKNRQAVVDTGKEALPLTWIKLKKCISGIK